MRTLTFVATILSALLAIGLVVLGVITGEDRMVTNGLIFSVVSMLWRMEFRTYE